MTEFGYFGHRATGFDAGRKLYAQDPDFAEVAFEGHGHAMLETTSGAQQFRQTEVCT